MALIQKLREAFPSLEMDFRDGHYRRIYDAESDILDHIIVKRGDGNTRSFAVNEEGRRKKRKSKPCENVLRFKISQFAGVEPLNA